MGNLIRLKDRITSDSVIHGGILLSQLLNDNDEIIDSCSTSSNNGYIRFTNGIQIAWVNMSAYVGGTLWTNNIYYSDHNLGNWGVPFTNVFLAIPYGNALQHWVTISETTNTSAGILRTYRPNGSKMNCSFGAVGIGLWK